MPFRTLTASFRWSLRTLLSTHQFHCLIHPSSIPLNFSSLAQPQASGQLVEGCDGFLPWLERKAGCRISSSLSIGESSYGSSKEGFNFSVQLCNEAQNHRNTVAATGLVLLSDNNKLWTLFASKTIQSGACILKVPYSVQITADNLPAEIGSLTGDEVGNIAKLAVVLLIEQKLGQDSEWNPYISCLPWLAELHNTIFWNESELEMIHQSSVYQETIIQKSQIEKDFLTISPVLKCFRQSFGDVTYKDFMYACTLVGSRAWGGTKGLSLIPFADFLNHDGVSEAIVMSDDDKQCSEVFADHDYTPGEQVLIRYGKFSNATLMLDFGFTVPYNIYDEVHIQLDIPKHDPLHDMKLEVLQQYFVPQTKDVKQLKHPMNFFTIKEVRSARGKGKGLPQSLRAFARVLSCTNPHVSTFGIYIDQISELNELVVEAAQTDGRLARRPLPDVNKEIQAHLMLSSLIAQLIEERSAAIMSLESSNSPSLCERVSVRRLMARDLLGGELRILKSASAWLKNYCFSLT